MELFEIDCLLVKREACYNHDLQDGSGNYHVILTIRKQETQMSRPKTRVTLNNIWSKIEYLDQVPFSHIACIMDEFNSNKGPKFNRYITYICLGLSK